MQRMNLELGFLSQQPIEVQFANEEERREAWERHRDELLEHRREGRRPDAWWCYDAPDWPEGAETRDQALSFLGDDADRAQLRDEWLLDMKVAWLNGGTRQQIRKRVCGNDAYDPVPTWFFDENFRRPDAEL